MCQLLFFGAFVGRFWKVAEEHSRERAQLWGVAIVIVGVVVVETLSVVVCWGGSTGGGGVGERAGAASARAVQRGERAGGCGGFRGHCYRM